MRAAGPTLLIFFVIASLVVGMLAGGLLFRPPERTVPVPITFTVRETETVTRTVTAGGGQVTVTTTFTTIRTITQTVQEGSGGGAIYAIASFAHRSCLSNYSMPSRACDLPGETKVTIVAVDALVTGSVTLDPLRTSVRAGERVLNLIGLSVRRGNESLATLELGEGRYLISVMVEPVEGNLRLQLGYRSGGQNRTLEVVPEWVG